MKEKLPVTKKTTTPPPPPPAPIVKPKATVAPKVPAPIVPAATKGPAVSPSILNPELGAQVASTAKAGTVQGSVLNPELYSGITTPTEGTSGKITVPAGPDQNTMDAFANLRIVFESYDMGDLAGTITRMMSMGLTANEALVKLKYDKTVDPSTGTAWNSAYTTRFAGNTARVAKGLNAISEAEYISTENAFTKTLKSYGLGNMLSVDRKVNQKKFAEYIGNDMSTTEFNDRIKTVEDRVINADANTKNTFKQFYPNLTDADLISYFLSPTDTLDRLKEKTAAAEIGGAAVGQGLKTDEATATDLAKFGVSRADAIAGYSNIKTVFPEATKYAQRYKELGTDYTQKTGEEEFLKSDAEAAKKRRLLASAERGQFQKQTGVGQGSLARVPNQ